MSLGTCRSCGASIRWVRVHPNLRLMPLDVSPAPGGNIVLDPDGTGRVQAVPVRGAPLLDRYVSHFATCPGAGLHRKGKKS